MRSHSYLVRRPPQQTSLRGTCCRKKALLHLVYACLSSNLLLEPSYTSPPENSGRLPVAGVQAAGDGGGDPEYRRPKLSHSVSSCFAAATVVFLVLSSPSLCKPLASPSAFPPTSRPLGVLLLLVVSRFISRFSLFLVSLFWGEITGVGGESPPPLTLRPSPTNPPRPPHIRPFANPLRQRSVGGDDGAARSAVAVVVASPRNLAPTIRSGVELSSENNGGGWIDRMPVVIDIDLLVETTSIAAVVLPRGRANGFHSVSIHSAASSTDWTGVDVVVDSTGSASAQAVSTDDRWRLFWSPWSPLFLALLLLLHGWRCFGCSICFLSR